ncbi:Uncharacterized conserved protein, DUF2267 family [Micromonospora purpureochromogenes]|uniref:Uncharacterized conserved protein, DUF2267 family n=1 Tax=Micromonospora purpureochromogenes TaxID=47872 RepID=A0A1C4YFR3_9ACTN|nr:DUF2267 domain-containing protein [Micromonospora purpureochromogenes]SCF19486.1 Uncharacterized conserved protein, DUF2267 family [Micromonospora purpureochromogenes]
MNYAEFLEAVGKRAEMPAAEAANVVGATLTTLAERVSGGEARHLATQLPEELRGYLYKDVDFAEQLDLVEFLNEVGVRAGTDGDRSAEAARAVLTTLREAVSAEDLKNLESELPKDVRRLLHPLDRGIGG